MTGSVRIAAALLSCVLLGGCLSTEPGTGSGGDCESHYSEVVRAPTWSGLEEALVTSPHWPRATSVRVQERGADIGLGDQDVVRIVDVLNEKGRRVVQLEVWRTDDGGWSAGSWSQCID